MVYLAFLAVADTLVLWAQSFLLLTYHRVSPAFCASRLFLLMWPEAQANWIIAALTIQRAALISFPIRAMSLGIGKPRTGCIAISIIIGFVLAINLPSLSFLEFDPKQGLNGVCVFNKSFKYVAEKVYPWLTVVVSFYLPMILIVGCNIFIIRILLKKLYEISPLSMKQTADNAQDCLRRAPVTISVVSIVYVALEFCNTFIRTKAATGKLNPLEPPPEFFGSMMGCQTNHAINIILYCLSGEQFRKEFFGLMLSICCIKRSKRTMTSKNIAAKTSLNKLSSSAAV